MDGSVQTRPLVRASHELQAVVGGDRVNGKPDGADLRTATQRSGSRKATSLGSRNGARRKLRCRGESAKRIGKGRLGCVCVCVGGGGGGGGGGRGEGGRITPSL